MPTVSYCGRSLFYQEAGEGPVLLFLHGNTASSRLFEPLLPLYAPHFRCVLLDFLGNGRSDRTEFFPTDLWQDQARQALALIRAAGYERPCLLGTSGGAWAAMNAALLAPDAVGAVVADSFDGRTLHPGFARELTEERARAKRDPAARGVLRVVPGPGLGGRGGPRHGRSAAVRRLRPASVLPSAGGDGAAGPAAGEPGGPHVPAGSGGGVRRHGRPAPLRRRGAAPRRRTPCHSLSGGGGCGGRQGISGGTSAA